MLIFSLLSQEQGGRKTFVDMLSYRHLPANDLKLTYEDAWSGGVHGRTRLYKVPITEFDILWTKLDSSNRTEKLTLPGPHTFVVTEGNVKAKVGNEEIVLKKYHTAFVRAEAELEIELLDSDHAEIWGSFYQ